MIRDFNKTDLEGFTFNAYSDLNRLESVIDNELWFKYSFLENDKVTAIGFFVEYTPQHWICFILMSRDFNFRNAKTLKKYFWNFIKNNNIIRIQTDSLDCPEINRWHEFLEFKLEGRREKFIDNKTFNAWGIVR